MAADPELGLVYFVTDPPTNDYWGGHHPGDNLFATSIIAVDIKTGVRRWHFQTVHHDIWNYDNPTAPNLVDITVDGKKIPALVQTTKQSWAYVLNRETGEPVWPIEERPVPASKIPGEKTSPTQPFPTRPAAYEMQGVTEDDIIDFTPELHEAALAMLSEYELGPLFNPPLHRDNDLGFKNALICPGGGGGTNIPGRRRSRPRDPDPLRRIHEDLLRPIADPRRRGRCPRPQPPSARPSWPGRAARASAPAGCRDSPSSSRLTVASPPSI